MRVLDVVLLLRAGHTQTASQAVADALALNAEDAEHWRAAGVVHAWQHDWEQAQRAFARALAFQTADHSWWSDVGLALTGAGAPAEACNVFERLLADPQAAAPTTLIRYGEALELLWRFDEARCAFARASENDPNAAEAFEGLVRTCSKLCRDEEALRWARRVARLRSFDTRSLHVLADAQFQSGHLLGCLHTYRRACRRDPSSPEIRSGYLFACLHDGGQSPLNLKRAHEGWFERHAGTLRAQPLFTNDPEPERRLRIGYLSSEFQTSPTQFFLLPLLRAHDRASVVVHCYQTSRTNDPVTAAYRGVADHWHNLAGAEAERVRAAVLADQIDILVDASGLFYPKVAPLFRMRAAPVQVALPIYASTTGCREIDYLISDRWTTPEGAGLEAHYSEHAIVRVPSGYVLYEPPSDAPPITELSAHRNGFVTFGLFQRPAKFNQQLWAAIAEIMRRVPASQLLVHYASIDLDEPSSSARTNITRLLADRGIAGDRLHFVGRRNLSEHLETVAQVDIALDTSPYSGHTTTCDSLWMGIPVVSMTGATHASRVSTGLLARVGLPDWATSSHTTYIARAVRAAQEIDRLAELRSSLRSRMAQSSICRHEIVVREIEAGYRAMWHRWCGGRVASRAASN